jgi:CheY-like chemotaxis protein
VTVAKSILVVDDNEVVRRATCRYLESVTGLDVCWEAVDGFDALEQLQYLKPDVIILDLAMPRMNGLETAREIRSTRNPVPIILFTMFADALPPQICQAAGINFVVSKTDPHVLHRHLESLAAVA